MGSDPILADKSFIADLCDNIFKFQAKLAIFKQKLSSFLPPSRQTNDNFSQISRDFTVQTGSATADKAFIADLCDNVFQLSSKISNFLKKKKKNLRISKDFTVQTGSATADKP